MRQPEALAVEELKLINWELEILIQMFAKAFPNSLPPKDMAELRKLMEGGRFGVSAS